MNIKLNRKLIIMAIALFLITILSRPVKAESFSSNKKQVQVGETFTINISGINGKVAISSNDKVSLSKSGTVFVEGALSITGTAKSVGSGNISVKLMDVTTTGADPKELSGTRNINVTVKEKEQPKPQTTPTNIKQETPKKTTENNKKKETKTTETKKVEIIPTEEKEEATPEWGIKEIKVVGIKNNEEKVDIELDKKFDINTYEYSCNVAADVKRVEIIKEAYEYNEFVKIIGAEEELKEGENVITLKLAKEGQKELTYTIKINKVKAENETEVKEEQTQETNAEIIEEKQTATITIPVWSFILLEIIIVAITATITFLIIKKVNENSK